MDLELLKKIEKQQAKRIANFLLDRIKDDDLLKNKLLETDKTLEGCISYVRNQAQKQAEDNMAWIADDEVYGWVIDFYLDDNIKETKVPKNSSEAKDINNSKTEKVIKPVKQEKPKVEVASKTKHSKEDEIKQKLYGEMDLFSL